MTARARARARDLPAIDSCVWRQVDAELGEFGILFLLFVEGLNLSPERIKALGSFLKLGANQLLFSIAVIFFGIFIGGPYILPTVGALLNLDDSLILQIESPVVAFAIASAGALSSSAFVLPILKEKGARARPVRKRARAH